MEIAPGIKQLKIPIPDNPLGHLNCYLVQGKDGWLIIDTGWYTPGAFETLQNELKSNGLTFTDIKTMVITHVHPDHFGLAGKIKELSPKTELLTHSWEANLIESRYVKFTELRIKLRAILERHGVPDSVLSDLDGASMPALKFVKVVFPDRVLSGGEIIDTGMFELEVIWTPGHSPGHICLYEAGNRFLFSGDHILPSITPNIGYHVQSGDNPLGDYLNSLHKLRNLAVSKILPAHEDIFTDLPGHLDKIKAHHERRKNEILHTIELKNRSAYDISSVISWNMGLPWNDFPSLHKRLAVTETIAHLEWLRYEGEVARIKEDGKVLYRSQA